MVERWVKFICPECNEKFKVKIDTRLDVIITKTGGEFECHIHCPRCEAYIPYRDRIK